MSTWNSQYIIGVLFVSIRVTCLPAQVRG